MRNRRGQGSIAASPVLIGATTVLIALVAVFIAYNANSGLPFVPSYELNAELPSGGKLVKGNEVRVGGFRVGVVKELKPTVRMVNGERRSVAVAKLSLDKKLEPLSRDTKLRVRPRSALGLKYIELQPGTSKQTYQSGDTVPVKNASEPLEFEDLFATFDRETRPHIQNATEGFGDAFAGRGQSINRSIEALNPFFRALTPVMTNLADPKTELDQFFLQIGRASAQAAPVARTQALLFTDMADTFAAISASPRALQDTIEKAEPTMRASIDSFRVQQPFYADFTDLSARLRPAAAELPRSLPAINAAFKAGTPVLPRTVELNENLEGALREAEDLFKDPNTLLALRDIDTALTVSRPAIQFIAPYQTVCNYFIYFVHPLGEAQSVVQTGATGGGTALNQNIKVPNSNQPNNYGSSTGSRPWDILVDQKPQGAKDSDGHPLFRLYAPPYQPAIDAQGNADCQLGQNGYPNGALNAGPYPRGNIQDGSDSHGLPIPGEFGTGANGAIVPPDNNLPGLSGGTYKSRELGIDNLSDVP
ncbi:MAG: phospholipid/cholesterol/gamma-HCH transport system substrate-binding protein [Thermoleophilaceae bacterium]|nr:phospholipid/cholesterol/gamma-HCH transport system substrate-binding protein [Thermoleophilaceae bacterium]